MACGIFFFRFSCFSTLFETDPHHLNKGLCLSLALKILRSKSIMILKKFRWKITLPKNPCCKDSSLKSLPPRRGWTLLTMFSASSSSEYLKTMRISVFCSNQYYTKKCILFEINWHEEKYCAQNKITRRKVLCSK